MLLRCFLLTQSALRNLDDVRGRVCELTPAGEVCVGRTGPPLNFLKCLLGLRGLPRSPTNRQFQTFRMLFSRVMGQHEGRAKMSCWFARLHLRVESCGSSSPERAVS